MFSRLHRTFRSLRPITKQFHAESPSGQAHCGRCINSTATRSRLTTAHQATNVKPSRRRGLKCPAGFIFLQRQFMRNLCLVQNKDVQQEKGLESTALQPKQQQNEEQSPVLSLFKGHTSASLVCNILCHENITQSRILADSHGAKNDRSPARVHSLLYDTGRNCPTCNKAAINSHCSIRHTSQNIPTRCYSTSTDPKDSSDKTEKAASESEVSPLKKQNIFTIPNGLTMSRICLTPLLGYLVIQESFSMACGLFFFAGLTDLMDGYIARRYPSQISAFGSFLDPLADKILISVLFVSLTFVKLIPLPLAVLVIGRDIGLIAAAFYVRYISLTPPITLKGFFDATHPSAQLQPMMISKVNTGLQLGLVTVSLAAPVFGFVDHVFLHYLWYLTAFTTTISGIGYILAKDTFKILQKKRK